MNLRKITSFTTLVLILTTSAFGQFTLKGKVTNTYQEPLRYVSVSIKELRLSTQTDAEGKYSFTVDEGKYDVAFTNVGYKPQLITLVVKDKDVEQNIILEPNKTNNEDVKVFAIRKDRWSEIMKNVIRNKDNYLNATSTFSCNVYIRATQENEKTVFKKRKDNDSIKPEEIAANNTEKIASMSMAEVVMQLDKGLPNKIKETRNGVKKRGNTDDLFYLSTTEGEFSLYQNLIKVPALTDIPMLSPISNAGLNAYNFKTIRLRKRGGRKFYTITFTPVKAGNALIEGEMEIMDSLWVVTEARYSFPNYLLNNYDYFAVEQTYDTLDTKMFMLNRQDLTYVSKLGKTKATGKTLALFSKYTIDPTFSKKYFSNELSATTDEAYNQDSTFWEQVRQEPLSAEQLQFIRYNDSIQRAHSTQSYMDSVDKSFNRITFSKIFLNGQGYYQRSKDRSIFIGPLLGIVQPFQFGGTRIKIDWDYHKTYGSRKSETIWGNIHYGFRNADLKGEIKVRKLYNTFKRGAYELNASRDFASLFNGGSWTDQLRRSGIYLKDDIGASHEIELLNGLYMTNRVEMSFRSSAADYKINTDSITKLWGLVKLDPQDRPISFAAYQAFFNTISLSYTPQQKYIREPREKVILGSKWPTFTATWRKGIPKFLGSQIDYDYVEFKINQTINAGLFGVSQYNFTYGSFLNKKQLKEPDYKFIRQRDRLVFLNPTNTFQGIDSSFPVFDKFYELHYVHNFKGSLINRIPFVKKWRIQEVVGMGFLYVPERNLRYFESFVGLEKTFKMFRDRYKIGTYIVFSEANKFKNPIQLKISFEKFNRRRNSWY
jgi:hypothetical protein